MLLLPGIAAAFGNDYLKATSAFNVKIIFFLSLDKEACQLLIRLVVYSLHMLNRHHKMASF